MAEANFANRPCPAASLRIVRGADSTAPGDGWTRGAQAARDAEVRGR